MSVSDIKGINQIRNIPRVGLADVGSPLPKPLEAKGGLVDLSEVISDSSRLVGISGFGRQLSTMYEEMKKTEDPEVRSQVLEGMRAVVGHIAGGSDPMVMADFVMSAEGMGGMSASMLKGFFTTARDIDEAGLDLGRWIESFVRTGAMGLHEEFLKASRDALAPVDGLAGSEDLKPEDVLGRMVATVRDIMNVEADDEARFAQLRGFIDGFPAASGAEARAEYIERYRSEHLSG